MAGICAYVPQISQTQLKKEKSYTVCCSDNSKNVMENYTLIPVKRAGFVVIKQVISLDKEDSDWAKR